MVFKNRDYEVLRKFQKELTETLGKDFWTDLSDLGSSSYPPVDIYENDGALVVVLELPGLKSASDVSIFLLNDKLLVKGRIDRPYEGFNLLKNERFSGVFEREITLSSFIERYQTTANYKHGLLEIVLYKSKNISEKQIKVRFLEEK